VRLKERLCKIERLGQLLSYKKEACTLLSKKRKACLAICCPISVKGARGVGGVPIATKGQTLLYSSIYVSTLCIGLKSSLMSTSKKLGTYVCTTGNPIQIIITSREKFISCISIR
jgi:hypothetical protein